MLNDMSLELDIIELYNPLYLLPIVGVVFCALLVYAFGLKSAAQLPNFSQLSDKKVIAVNVIKRRKLTPTKTHQNGSVDSEPKTEKKIIPKKSEDKPIAAKKINNQVKKDRKSAKNEEQSVERVEAEDRDAGEWIELVSRKERKNRKLNSIQ